MARVWADSSLSGSELLMLLAIADFADDDGNAYPAVPTLATKCRTTPRHANRLLSALRASGELEIRVNEGPRGTNRYRVKFEGMTATSPLTKPSPLTPASRTPDLHVPKPLTPMSDEPSLNHQEPPTLARNVVARQDPDGFAEFWAAWPASSRKQDRKKCAEKWKRNKLARALSQILAHVTAMKGTKTWREGFEPAPLTYLTGERWNDGMPPVERALSPLHADDVFEAAR